MDETALAPPPSRPPLPPPIFTHPRAHTRSPCTGFLVVPGFLSQADVAALRARGQALLDGFDPSGPEAAAVFSSTNQFRVSTAHFLGSATTASFFFEEGAFDAATGRLTARPARCVNKIAHALHDVDPAFRAFARSPAVAGLASALGFARPLPVQSMYICKQPGIGGEVIPHQDSTFLATDPPSTVGVWVALEDADEANGCMWALPGSHKGGVLRRFGRGLGEEEAGGEGGGGGSGGGASTRWYEGHGGNASSDGPAAAAPSEPPLPHIGFDRPAPAYDLSAGVPLPAPAGTLILLHGSVLHWSAPNTGSASRHAFTVHLAEGGEGAVWCPENWLQRPADKPFEPLYDVEGGGGGAAAVTA